MVVLVKLRLYVDDPDDNEPWQGALLICDLIEDCELDVIDINEHPNLAEEDAVIDTPTLVIHGPVKRRIVGDFSNPKAAATYLTLPEW
jgi:hypothetical protein